MASTQNDVVQTPKIEMLRKNSIEKWDRVPFSFWKHFTPLKNVKINKNFTVAKEVIVHYLEMRPNNDFPWISNEFVLTADTTAERKNGKCEIWSVQLSLWNKRGKMTYELAFRDNPH